MAPRDDSDDEGVFSSHNVDFPTSTYAAPVVALLQKTSDGVWFWARIFGFEFLAIAVWVVQVYIMQLLMPITLPWATIKVASFGGQVLQVLTLILLLTSIRAKVEGAIHLVVAILRLKPRANDGGGGEGALFACEMCLAAFNGTMLLTLLFAVIYNGACCIFGLYDPTAILFKLFTFGTALMVDTTLAEAAMTSGIMFGEPYYGKKPEKALVDFSTWQFILEHGDPDDESEDEDTVDHLRIVGPGKSVPHGPLISKALCGKSDKGGVDEGVPKAAIVCRCCIRWIPALIIIVCWIPMKESSIAYCPEVTNYTNAITASLAAKNRRAITDVNECDRAAKHMGLKLDAEAVTGKICQFDKVANWLTTKDVAPATPEVGMVVCQNHYVSIDIRPTEHIRMKWFGKLIILMHARRQTPICAANNFFQIPDVTECGEALKMLGIDDYGPGRPQVGYPSVHFSNCLGKGFLGLPVGICKTPDEFKPTEAPTTTPAPNTTNSSTL